MRSAAGVRRPGQVWFDLGQSVGGGPLAHHVMAVVAEQWTRAGLDCLCLGPDEIALVAPLRVRVACPIVCANFRHDGVAPYWDRGGVRVSSVVAFEAGGAHGLGEWLPALEDLFTSAAAAELLPVVAVHTDKATRRSVLAWLRSVRRRFLAFDVGSRDASERGVARYGGGLVIRFTGQGRSFADVDWDEQDPRYWANGINLQPFPLSSIGALV